MTPGPERRFKPFGAITTTSGGGVGDGMYILVGVGVGVGDERVIEVGVIGVIDTLVGIVRMSDGGVGVGGTKVGVETLAGVGVSVDIPTIVADTVGKEDRVSIGEGTSISAPTMITIALNKVKGNPRA
jgi:hypothetical protein